MPAPAGSRHRGSTAETAVSPLRKESETDSLTLESTNRLTLNTETVPLSTAETAVSPLRKESETDSLTLESTNRLLFVRHCNLIDNSLPLQSAYLSIYSAYLAIIFDDLAVVLLLERGYSLWFRASYIWD